MSLKGTVVAVAAVGVSILGAQEMYRQGGEAYLAELEARLPADGLSQSMVPFLVEAHKVGQAEGLHMVLMGGLAKQALCDEKTVIDPVNRLIIVSDDPTCHTRKRDTLYREEMTIRDQDWFVYELGYGELMPRATPIHDKEIEKRAAKIQKALHKKAKELGFPSGPEVSMFNYETARDKFRLHHYSTRTEVLAGGHEEVSHSLGAGETFKPQDIWTLVINTPDGVVEIPTSSPVRLLGRTHTRSLIYRDRDRAEVEAAVANITSMGLADELLGEEWNKYESLRNELNQSLSRHELVSMLMEGRLFTAGNMAAALLLAPLAPKVEASWLGKAIRDPYSKIGKQAAKIMNAKNTNSLPLAA